MNKAEIKQIILEEIENVMNNMASDLNNRELVDPLATILSIPDTEDDEIEGPGIEDLSPDPIFGPDPSYVEEMARPKETWVATPKLEALLQHFVGKGGVDGLTAAMERISKVLTKTQNVGFKSRAKKYQKRFFTDEAGNVDKAKLRQFAELLLNPAGFTQSDIQNFVGFKNSAQANAFKMKLYKAKLINVQQPQDDSEDVSESKKKLEFDFSQVETPEKLPIDVDEQDLMDNIKKELKSSSEDYQNDDDSKTAKQLKDAVGWVDKNALKGKVTLEEVYNFLTEFHKQLPDDDKMFLHEPTILELIEDEFKPYVDTEKEYQEIVSSVKQYLSSKQPQQAMNELKNFTNQLIKETSLVSEGLLKARDIKNLQQENPEVLDLYQNVLVPLATQTNLKNKIIIQIDPSFDALFIIANGDLDPTEQSWYPTYLDFLKKVQEEAEAVGLDSNTGDPDDEDGIDHMYIALDEPLYENKTTMTNLEKYIRQQIKEAKNPLASKMKEIENQGKMAALETKLAAVAEMIEETNARLTRIDEDEEFTEMMDKNAVKGVRKQLKELERIQAKLQKEYGKYQGKGMKRKKVVDEDEKSFDEKTPEEMSPEDTKNLALAQAGIPEEVELEEDNFALNESVKRMQKLAGLKG